MPNIAIYEGGKAARMNGVSRITTDDGNDGKIVWVPQSDRQTGTLYVSENGTYRAEDEGLHSWSKVTVRLAGAPLGLEVPTLPDPITGAEIPTGELGELEPVPPAGLEPIEDEPISTDEAEKILEEAGLDPSDLESDDALEAIADALGTDPEDVKVIDPEKNEDVKKEQPKVEDKGQKAVGTDPDTGDPATITPSGKEGAIVPDELRIVTPPSKTSYEDGETIDYSGIQCALYKDGKFIRNATFDELSFPVTTATYDGNRIEYTDGDGLNTLLLTAVVVEGYYQRWASDLEPRVSSLSMTPYVGVDSHGYQVGIGSNTGETFSVYVTRYNGTPYAKLASGYPVFDLVTFIAEKPTKFPAIWGAVRVGSASYVPKSGVYTQAEWGPYLTGIPESTTDPRLEGSKPLVAVGQKQPVPVQWSGDGASLGSSFEIMVYMDNV